MDSTHPEAVTIEIGGEKKHLRYGPSCFRLAQDRHDVRVEQQVMDNPGIADLVTLFWLGLLPGDPDTTLEDATLMLAQADDEFDVMEKVLDAMLAMGDRMRRMGERRATKAAKPKPTKKRT